MQLASAPWRQPLSPHSIWTRSPATPRISCACRASPATSGRRWSWSPNARRPPASQTELAPVTTSPPCAGSEGHPGEEAARDELWGVTATLPGGAPRRLALNGHIDVVGPGTEPWQRDPWSGAIEDGRLHGRGSVDMKGAVIAALHALAALRRAGVETPEVVLQAVASEEDGGLGTFAALERDAAFDAALLPEPTGLRVVCAQAGALTFRGVVGGRSAHAAERLAGCSAIDRYVRVHAALQRPRGGGQRGRRAPADARAAAARTRCSSARSRAATGRARCRTGSSSRAGSACRSAPSLADARAALQATVDAALDDGEGRACSSGRAAPSRPGETSPDASRGCTRAAAPCATSSAASRSWPACRGARTCACSRPAASRR